MESKLETLTELNRMPSVLSSFDDIDDEDIVCAKDHLKADCQFTSGVQSPNEIESSLGVDKDSLPETHTDVILQPTEGHSPSADPPNHRSPETVVDCSVVNRDSREPSGSSEATRSEPESGHHRNADMPSVRDVDSDTGLVTTASLSEPRLNVDLAFTVDHLTFPGSRPIVPLRSPSSFETPKKERQMSPVELSHCSDEVEPSVVAELSHCSDEVEPSVVRRLESFVSMMGTRRHRHHHGVVQHNYKVVDSSSATRNGHHELDVVSGTSRRTAMIEDHDMRNSFRTEAMTSPFNGLCQPANHSSQSKSISGRSWSAEAPLDLSLRGTATEPALPVGSASLTSPFSLVNDFGMNQSGSILGAKRRSVGDNGGGINDSLLKLEKTFGENSRILDRVGYAGATKRRDVTNVAPLSQNGGLSSGFGTSLFGVGVVATPQQTSAVAGLVPPCAGIYNTALRDLTTSVSSVGGLNNQHSRTGSKSILRRHYANTASSSSAALPHSQKTEQATVESVSERRRSLSSFTSNSINGDESRYSTAAQKTNTELESAPAADSGKLSSAAAAAAAAAGVRRLVRGQDAWMNGTGQLERRSSVLRCLECGMSFWSLPDLTLHMIRTAHYANIIRTPVSSAAGTSTSASPSTSSALLAQSTMVPGSAEVTTSTPSTSPDAIEYHGKDDDKKNPVLDVDSERDADADASSAESEEIDDVRWRGQSDAENITRFAELNTCLSLDRYERHQMNRRHRKRKQRHSTSSGASSSKSNETESKRRRLEDRNDVDISAQSTRTDSGLQLDLTAAMRLTTPSDGGPLQRQRIDYQRHRRRGESNLPDGSISSTSTTPPSSPGNCFGVQNSQPPVLVKSDDAQSRTTASALSAMENFIGRSLIEMDKTVAVSAGTGPKPTITLASVRNPSNTRDRTPQPTAISRSTVHQPSFSVAPNSDALPSLFGCSSSEVSPSAALAAQLCWSPFILDYLVANRLLGGSLPVMTSGPAPLVPSAADACRDLFGFPGNGSFPATSILPMFAAAAAAAAASVMPVLEPDEKRRMVDEVRVCSVDGKGYDERNGRKESITSAAKFHHRFPQPFFPQQSNGSANIQFRTTVTKTPGFDEERSSSSASPGSGSVTPASASVINTVGGVGGGSSQALDSLRGFVYGSNSSTTTTTDFAQPMHQRRAVEEQRASLSTSSSSSSLSSTPVKSIEFQRYQHHDHQHHHHHPQHQQHQQLSQDHHQHHHHPQHHQQQHSQDHHHQHHHHHPQHQQQQQHSETKKRMLDSAHATPAIDNACLKSGHQRHGIVSPPTSKDARESVSDQAWLPRISASMHKNGYAAQLPQKDPDRGVEIVNNTTRSRTMESARGKSNHVTAEPEAEGDGEYDSRFDKYYKLARELTKQVH